MEACILKKNNDKNGLQNDFEQALEAQERFIGELRRIIANGQVLSESEQAVVVFNTDNYVVKASLLFCSLTGIKVEDIPRKRYFILNLLENENIEIFYGAQDALDGKTRYIKNLVRPLEMFLPEWRDKRIPAYTKALFFPLSETDRKYGAAVFMK